jgi:hypothetical protein
VKVAKKSIEAMPAAAMNATVSRMRMMLAPVVPVSDRRPHRFCCGAA